MPITDENSPTGTKRTLSTVKDHTPLGISPRAAPAERHTPRRYAVPDSGGTDHSR